MTSVPTSAPKQHNTVVKSISTIVIQSNDEKKQIVKPVLTTIKKTLIGEHEIKWLLHRRPLKLCTEKQLAHDYGADEAKNMLAALYKPPELKKLAACLSSKICA